MRFEEASYTKNIITFCAQKPTLKFFSFQKEKDHFFKLSLSIGTEQHIRINCLFHISHYLMDLWNLREMGVSFCQVYFFYLWALLC